MEASAANPIDVPRGWLSGRRLTLISLLAIIAVLSTLMLIRQHNSHSRLEQAKEALRNDQPQLARELLKSYMEGSPADAEGHFVSASAARQCGDFLAAESHLEASERYGWEARAIELERAMIMAQSRNLRQVEGLLQQAVQDQVPESPQVLAVLVPALMAEFRWVEAERLTQKWTELKPNFAPAWARRGEILERLRRKSQSVDALRVAVRLDPSDRKSRFALARLLLETRQSLDEAAEQLRWLRDAEPRNLAVEVQFAACREAQGFADEAATMLDRLIVANPQDAMAAYFRGRLELTRGNAKAAYPLLRKASALDPSDPEILYSLLLAVREVGSPEEVDETQRRLHECNADLKRVAELGRAISVSPRDPDLRREMGELFLKNGREQEGISWLNSALRERSDHRPTHKILAQYYERVGELHLAEFHRALIDGPTDR